MATRSDRKRITKWSQRDRNSSLGSFWCWILLPFFTSVIRSNSKFGNLEVSNPASWLHPTLLTCRSLAATWNPSTQRPEYIPSGKPSSSFAATWVHSTQPNESSLRGYLPASYAAHECILSGYLSASSVSFLIQCILQTSLFSSLRNLYQFLQTKKNKQCRLVISLLINTYI